MIMWLTSRWAAGQNSRLCDGEFWSSPPELPAAATTIWSFCTAFCTAFAIRTENTLFGAKPPNERLMTAAPDSEVRHEPAGTEADRQQRADFADTFARVLGDPNLPHRIFVDDGSRAVARAVRFAGAWKSRHNAAHGRRAGGDRMLALRPTGVDLAWTGEPARRIPGPARGKDAEHAALEQVQRAFEAHRDDIACLVVEPVPEEGNDRLSARVLRATQPLCHDNDALLVLDEVRTGVGLTGTPWAHQQFGLAPDVVAFGDRLRVGGVMMAYRMEPAANDVVGGRLVDLVHARRVLEVVEARSLCGRAARLGRVLVAMLERLAARFPDHATDVRGRGLMCAFDLCSTAVRDQVVVRLRNDERVLVRPGGPRSIWLRAPLTVNLEELEAGVCAMHRVLAGLVGQRARAA